MQSIFIIGRWYLLLSIFGFGQLLGILVYFRLKRFSPALARIAGFIIPAALFFYFAPIMFFAGLREAQAQTGVGCGNPMLGGIILTFFGTGLQLFIGMWVQMYLYSRSLSRLDAQRR